MTEFSFWGMKKLEPLTSNTLCCRNKYILSPFILSLKFDIFFFVAPCLPPGKMFAPTPGKMFAPKVAFSSWRMHIVWLCKGSTNRRLPGKIQEMFRKKTHLANPPTLYSPTYYSTVIVLLRTQRKKLSLFERPMMYLMQTRTPRKKFGGFWRFSKFLRDNLREIIKTIKKSENLIVGGSWGS